MACFCPIFYFANCLEDQWAPEKPDNIHDEKYQKNLDTYNEFVDRNEHRNVKIFLITAIAGGILVLIQTALFCLIKSWA